MNFFCTKEHYRQWTADRNLDENEIFMLSAKEALVVAEFIFKLEE